ncbi:MAG: hypothetical protein MR851_00380 [[Clostridium] scindens]|uniref:hypothetical protein n=1 Tax=Clostridium scindens (strain JCM 10418 / VPI 12708) TaxID=29347 RepID=UPI00242D1585|nr:hypothetical protein [[Clostridium] scindens]MCI6394721.1 hypothetical protein [[Clostridium] scindens]MDY4866219.1 hypothetical protein [[Clostridium] scindens]
MKNDGRIHAGDKVVFTGHGYRRAIAYRYADMFGSRTYTVKETRRSCCNTFLVLEEIEGMYSEIFFSRQ